MYFLNICQVNFNAVLFLGDYYENIVYEMLPRGAAAFLACFLLPRQVTRLSTLNICGICSEMRHYLGDGFSSLLHIFGIGMDP